MAKSLILPGRLLWNLAIHQILYTCKVKLNWILFPASKNNVLSKKFEFWRRGSSAKLGLFINQPILPQFFCVTSTESLVCWVIMSWVIQVDTIHTSSQLLSVWSISAHIQCGFWSCFINTIIFHQNDFVPNFPLYILIEGSSQTLLVISQFFSFFCWDASYLSWEASQQNFVFIFLLPLTSPNFRNNKKKSCDFKFYFLSKIHC